MAWSAVGHGGAVAMSGGRGRIDRGRGPRTMGTGGRIKTSLVKEKTAVERGMELSTMGNTHVL